MATAMTTLVCLFALVVVVCAAPFEVGVRVEKGGKVGKSVKESGVEDVKMVKEDSNEEECKKQDKLVCVVEPTDGYKTKGVVRFVPYWSKGKNGKAQCLVRIKAKVEGLSPGKHGFHIHTYGDIRVLDGTSTGGHFSNPNGDEIQHGFQGDRVRHWGDLNNLKADKKGVAMYHRVDWLIKLKGIVGRGVTIHQLEDMGGEVQPTGGAGPRVGFCVIGVANPALK